MRPTFDLTPFDFTPTESAAYVALLSLGPASGYAVAKHMHVARANAYQALDGLAAKGAASLATDTPRVYRAVSPQALLALLTQAEAAKLDRLEEQLAALQHVGEPATIPFRGERRLEQLVLRTAARATRVRCVGPEALLRRLVPIWRKRSQDEAETELLVLGELPDAFPVPLAGSATAKAPSYFGGRDPFVLVTESAVILGTIEDEITGTWSSEPLFAGLARAALDTLAG